MNSEIEKQEQSGARQFFVKAGSAIKNFFCKVWRLTKENIKIPGIGFGCLFVAFVLAIVAFCNYYALYDMAGYDENRWTVMFSWLTILVTVFLMISALFKGDRPFWLIIAYAAAAFMFAFAALAFMQPCVSEIAFVFGSPDLAMGDNAIRVAICDDSITTAVLYVVTCVFIMIAAFAPSTWTFGKKNRARKAAANAKALKNSAASEQEQINDERQTSDDEENKVDGEAEHE